MCKSRAARRLCAVNDHRTDIARLGADNAGVTIKTINPGDQNFLSPPPVDRNQPNQFAPGNSSWDYQFGAGSSALTAAGTLTWAG